MSLILGTALVRIQPSLAGFGTAMSAGMAGSAGAFTKAGVAASILVSAPIIAGVAASVNAAVNFETAFAGVKKTVTGTEADFKMLEDGIVNMANRMPFAREEIASVVEAAGRFGIATPDLLGFSEVALQLGTATSMGAAEAAESLTRLGNIIGLPDAEFRNLASSIVALGNDFPTTEAEITKFALRLGGAGELIGLTAADITGFAAGLSSLGVKAEAGGTAFSRVFITMNDAALTGGEKLQGFLDIMGVTKAQFEASWKSNPAEAIMQFVGGVKRLNESGANTPAILKEMGLGEIRVRDALLRSASGYDTMLAAMSTAHTGYEQGTALQQEYEKRLDTTASQWQIFKNNISSIGLTLGQALIPVLNDLMTVLKPIVEIFGIMAKGFTELPGPVKQMVMMFVLLVAAVGPLMVIVPRLVTAFSMLKGGFTALTAVMSANPWVAFGAALILLAIIIIQNWDKVKLGIQAIWEWIQFLGPIIVGFLSGVWDAIWAKVVEVWGAITSWISDRTENIKNIFQGLVDKGGELVDWFSRFPERVHAAWENVKQWTRNAVDAIKSILGELRGALDKVMGPFDEIIGGVWKVTGGLAKGLLQFDTGGVVPGPVGAPMLAMVHGGETILPTHKPGVIADLQPTTMATGGNTYNTTVVLENAVIRNDDDVVSLAREIEREKQRVIKAKGG